MTTQPESKLSRQIMSALRARGIWCMKIHGGPTMLAGAPDIIACVPVEVWTNPVDTAERPSYHGRAGMFVGFETKMPGNQPTPIQLRQHGLIRDAGGAVYVPHSVAEALDFIRGVTGTIDAV